MNIYLLYFPPGYKKGLEFVALFETTLTRLPEMTYY